MRVPLTVISQVVDVIHGSVEAGVHAVHFQLGERHCLRADVALARHIIDGLSLRLTGRDVFLQ